MYPSDFDCVLDVFFVCLSPEETRSLLSLNLIFEACAYVVWNLSHIACVASINAREARLPLRATRARAPRSTVLGRS